MTFDQLYNIILENDGHRSYSCLMLNCSFLGDDLRKFQDSIDPNDIDTEGLEKSPHITILYGIHTNRPDEVYNELDLYPINFKISGISLFENDEYDVLKLSITSKDLHEMNSQCEDRLTYTSSYPEYIPHLTVGYLKKGTGKKYLKYKLDIIGKNQVSNKFTFSDNYSQKVEWFAHDE